jgi:ubiquinone/menaquinone biosynthesis C-methylase UbiE
MLNRTLEPEVMDTEEDAREYDAMDHSTVNAQFVTDLLDAVDQYSKLGARLQILDLGVGTAQIPIELARRAPNVDIAAVDAAESMLSLARQNIASAALNDRIHLVLADAKHLPFSDGLFPVVISNSIAHHIPEPRTVFAEAVRVTAHGGLLFHRDLARPADDSQLQQLVETYAGDSNSYRRRLFTESLRAALTVDEVRELIAELGFAPNTVQMTSDRHWTWQSTKPAPTASAKTIRR